MVYDKIANRKPTNQNKMASYHKSEIKQNNREFKLKYAKKALRTAPLNRSLSIYTLCGSSIWFESQVLKYSEQKYGKNILNVHSFNITKEELEKARNDRWKLPLETYLNLHLNNCPLTPKRINGESDFTDFDTCKFFFKKNANDTIALAQKSRFLALTIIISGRHCCEDWLICPEGMTKADVQNPIKVSEYVEKNTNMRCVDALIYKNPGAKSTMATLIFERLEKVPKSDKEMVREMLVAGMETAEIAKITKFPINSIRAMKAWMHPSFQGMKKQ